MNGSVNITDIGTLVGTPIGNRMFYSQGQGVISTEDGREKATWTGQGLQTVTDEGKASVCLNISGRRRSKICSCSDQSLLVVRE
jgi:hypothetical protein